MPQGTENNREIKRTGKKGRQGMLLHGTEGEDLTKKVGKERRSHGHILESVTGRGSSRYEGRNIPGHFRKN
jgi:hypothetical protein